jgi:hypothetical protein
MMNRLVLGLSIPLFAFVVGALGCAGQLTTAEQEELCKGHPGCLGSAGPATGSGGSTGAGGSTGTGGGVMFDPCINTAMKTCQVDGCHKSAVVSAGLNLETTNLTMNFKTMYLNKPNMGEPMAGCMPGVAKLIDSAAPEMSLIYSTLLPTPPCGGKMPVIGTFGAADKTCILNWINKVIAAP